MRTIQTIQSSDAIGRILQGGRRYRGRSLTVFVAPCEATAAGFERAGGGQVAFIAPKRLGNAVYRNRCKRLLRAGLQAVCAEGPAAAEMLGSNDILFMANEGTNRVSPRELAREMSGIFEKLPSFEGVIQ